MYLSQQCRMPRKGCNAGASSRSLQLLTCTTALVVFLSCTLLSTSLTAQMPIFDQAFLWNGQAPYHDTEGRSIQQTRDGGFINLSNAWTTIAAQVSKFDDQGGLVWQEYYWEDPGLLPWSIHQTNPGDEGYIFVGETGYGLPEAVAFKIDDVGNILWFLAHDFGIGSWGRCVEVLQNGNYAMCGFVEDPSVPGGKVAFLMILTPGGSIQSINRIQFPMGHGCSTYDIRAYSLRQTANGDLIMTGTYKRECGPDVNDGILLMRLNISAGVSLLWANVYEAAGYSLHGRDVRQTCDMGFVVAGTATDLQNNAERAVVLRTDQAGTLNWSSLYGVGNLDCNLWAVEESFGRDIVAAGNIVNSSGQNRQFITRFTADGVLHMAGDYYLATTALGSSNDSKLFDMEITETGSLLLSGSSNGLGISPNSPNSYVSNTYCQSEQQCNYTRHANAAEISDLTESVANNLTLVTEPFDPVFLHYEPMDNQGMVHPGCPLLAPNENQFVHHFNDHFDRAFAGVAHNNDYGNGQEDVYTLTGWTADLFMTSPNQIYSRRLPLLTHRADGSVASYSFLSLAGAQGHDIKLTGTGGFIIAGQRHQSAQNNKTDHNALLVRTDKDGVPDFTISIGKTFYDTYQDDLQEVVNIPAAGGPDAGGYLAVGHLTRDVVTKDPEGLVVRVDQAGNVQWIKSYEIEQRDELEFRSVHAIDKNGDGLADDGFIIAGMSRGSWGSNGVANRDAFVMEIDGNGTIIWSKNYAASNWEAQSIIQTDDDADGVADDGYILCGQARDNSLLVLKLDNAGAISWSRVFSRSTNDFGMSIIQRADGGFSLTGVTKYVDNGVSPAVNHNEQLYLVHLDDIGNIDTSYATPVGSLYPGAEDCGMDINELPDGSLHVLGSTCSYDQNGKGDYFSIKTGCQDLCTFRTLDDETSSAHTPAVFTHIHDNCGAAGNTLCSHSLSPTEWTQTEEAIRLTEAPEAYVLCLWDEPCTQQSGLVSSAPEHTAIALPKLTIAPNPVSGSEMARVQFPHASSIAATLLVTDIRGREVMRLSVRPGQEQLDIEVQTLATGVYTVTLSSQGAQTAIGSFIKQ